MIVKQITITAISLDYKVIKQISDSMIVTFQIYLVNIIGSVLGRSGSLIIATDGNRFI